eukprot:CAMPEP_0194239166 /NCGR_PEP_ID=MMETSP0158-20130606/5710_1 /TAXON_ID=33649 /ORGANISM="Thalassionema nitzschioides, Strain L26-B" /LENGTH=413 /DNA_ID=CAMNT_0038973581 /DNA_START=68 /DNA_END=1309 /DNA_ORIENTATION=+
MNHIKTLVFRRRPYPSRLFSAVPSILEEPTRPRLEDLRRRLANEDPQLPSNFATTVVPSSENRSRQMVQQHTVATPSNSNILTDRYQRHHSYLRISLSERCNLRCQYCMPPEGVPLQPSKAILTRGEIQTLVQLFHHHGVNKVRLTGGEPLLRKDVVGIVEDIRQIGIHHIGMTTNAMTLSRHLDSLVEAGLTHLNISLDTLQEDKFTQLTRRPGFSKVMKSIELASKTSLKVKINCVVMKNINEDEIVDFCHWQHTHFPDIDMRFIEWMPFHDNGWTDSKFVPYSTMVETLQSQLPSLQRVADGPNDTTKWWKASSGKGRIGFITSMSEHFCGTCNRLRLTADGKLKTCLFGTGGKEVSLRDVIRSSGSPNDLETMIQQALQEKHKLLGGHGTPNKIAEHSEQNRPMTLIGG